MIRGVVLFALALTVASCSTQTEGSPSAESTREPAGDYRAALADDARAQLAYLDSIRSLDPCSLLSDVAVTAIGVPAYFGNMTSPDHCRVVFASGAGPKTIRSIDVEIEPGNIAGEPGGPRETTIGGKTANVGSLTSDSCRAYVNVDEFVYLSYGMTAARDGDVCPELTAVIEASLPAMESKPSRVGSARWHATPLDTLDPCGVLAELEIGDDPYVNGSVDSCDFALDGGPSGSRQSISFRYYPPGYFTSTSTTTLDVLGAPATESMSSLCAIDVGVGHDSPFTDPQNNSGELIDVIAVQAETCADARTLAAAVTRQYQQGR